MNAAAETRYVKIGNSLIEVGRFTYGNDRMQIRQWGEGAKLVIGAFCSIAEGVNVMLGGNHRVDWSTTFPFGHIFYNELGGSGILGHPQSKGDVLIGNDVWIGHGVTIMSGVRIGDGAVIATNSTVTKNVGSYQIWGGNPAKFIKRRFDEEVEARLITLKWWDLDIEMIRRIAPLLSQVPTHKLLDKIDLIVQKEEKTLI